jgi:cytochrome c biogenesis protein CcmG/thiol:disulfide interchange protein DsbE
MIKKSPNQPTFGFFLFLVSGLLIGLGLSWAVYSAPSNSISAQPTPSAPTKLVEVPTSQPENTPKMAILAGNVAPDFTLRNIIGEEISLSDFAGKPILINLWATWCIPCKNELPIIGKIAQDYSSSGLVVLGVNVTFQDNLSDIKETIQNFNLSYPILLDESRHVSELYEMRGIPTSYFIDPQGVIRRIQIGEILPEYLESYLSEILPRK